MPVMVDMSLDYFQEHMCKNCVNYRYDKKSDSWGCALTDVAFIMGYDVAVEKNKNEKSLAYTILYELLLKDDKCAMFYSKKQAKRDLAKERPEGVPPLDRWGLKDE